MEWFIQYPRLSVITSKYGISLPVGSALIKKATPAFVGFFTTFIPNSFSDDPMSSHLSPHIIGIIDGTVHKIRRPPLDQHLWWNDHYKFHAVHSLFLVDFNGLIVAVETGIPGSFHDATVAKYTKRFKTTLKGKFVLGDPGFGGVDYVIAGFKSNQLSTPAHKEFDRISRSEQVKIEHVNNFVKKCGILSKTTQCIHEKTVLSGCVFIGAGLYNYLFSKHGKYVS